MHANTQMFRCLHVHTHLYVISITRCTCVCMDMYKYRYIQPKVLEPANQEQGSGFAVEASPDQKF